MVGGESPAAHPWYRRLLFPQRTIRPTRDGWWCLFAALGLGVAAVNTGNNLAYLLCSMLLAIITVSGMLSDQSLRGVRLLPVLPDEVYAGRAALFGAAAGGAPGVRRVIEILASEIKYALAMIGVSTFDQLSRQMLQRDEHPL